MKKHNESLTLQLVPNYFIFEYQIIDVLRKYNSAKTQSKVKSEFSKSIEEQLKMKDFQSFSNNFL